jgi:transcriptional regulator with XRE-family HTH domain
MATRRRDAVDALVGRNIRLLRLQQNISQTELGNRLGVTFQQVQKYENGTNRVGSGRLFKIANVFGVPISALFDGAENTIGNGHSRSPTALLIEPHALRLMQAFCALKSTDMRRAIVNLVENLASHSTTSSTIPAAPSAAENQTRTKHASSQSDLGNHHRSHRSTPRRRPLSPLQIHCPLQPPANLQIRRLLHRRCLQIQRPLGVLPFANAWPTLPTNFANSTSATERPFRGFDTRSPKPPPAASPLIRNRRR